MHAQACGQGVGIIVIDLYGTELRDQGLDRRYDGGQTVLDNMRDLLIYACDHQVPKRVPVINFVMAAHTTIAQITEVLPPWTVNRTKPTHNSFDRTDLQELMRGAACKYWVVFGFNANQCVAATIFGSLDSQKIKRRYFKEVIGAGRVEQFEYEWCPGILDRGFHVITSRLILASNNGSELSAREGWPDLGPANDDYYYT